MSRRRCAGRETTPPPRPARPSRAPEVLLAAFTFLVYCASFRNGLTNWDDPHYVTLNEIATQGWSGLGAAFTRTFDGAYYPLTQIAYTLLHLFGSAPAAYHVVQAALFALAVALVPAALAPFGVRRRVAIAAALLWAVHPLRVESVVWAANLKDSLAAPLVLASFALYGRGRRWQAAVAFAVALLAKSMFFPLAALFPVADGLAGHRPLAALRRSWPFAASGAAIAVASGALYLLGPGEPLAPTGLGERLSTALWTPWWYLGRLLWPAAPQAVYDFALVQPWSGRFFAALALWAAFAVLVWRSPPAWARAAWVAAAAFVLPLLTIGGLVSIKYVVADRYTLFPSLAACTALAAALALVPARRALAVATAVLTAACVPLNVLRQTEWRSGVALWEANASAAPDVWTVRVNLADAYALEHRWGDAVREIAEAMRRHPERHDVLPVALYYQGAQDGLPPAELD